MAEVKKFLLKIIDIYQKQISPVLGHHGIHCKYVPTCSEYSKQAILKYGAFYGIFLTFKRFLKCNPFSKGGYDPVK